MQHVPILRTDYLRDSTEPPEVRAVQNAVRIPKSVWARIHCVARSLKETYATKLGRQERSALSERIRRVNLWLRVVLS